MCEVCWTPLRQHGVFFGTQVANITPGRKGDLFLAHPIIACPFLFVAGILAGTLEFSPPLCGHGMWEGKQVAILTQKHRRSPGIPTSRLRLQKSHFGVLRPLSGCCVSLIPGRGEQADSPQMGNRRQNKVPSAVFTRA